MKHLNLHVLTTVLILGYAALSSASDKSVTVFPAEGNGVCSDYSSNNLILQMGTGSPLVSGTVYGVENPRDADTSGESAAYAIAGKTVASFSASTTPIDYAILKSSRNISLIIYPAGGVTSDANMSLVVAGVPQTISAINLCYGLGNVAPTPPPVVLKTLKSCNTSSTLDTTGVACGGTARSLVCNFELDKSFYGLKDGSDSCCVCNSAALTECDPNVPAGEPNACTSTSAKALPTEVTTHLELNNDPYYCTTVGSGPRICYAY